MDIIKRLGAIISVSFLFGISCPSFSEIQNGHANFSVKPRKCVALHQGQTCYQKLKFNWKIPQQGEFCLHLVSQTQPLVCWRSGERTRFEYEFKSTRGERFQIRSKNSLSHIAELEVITAWVYKSKKRKTGSWRLF